MRLNELTGYKASKGLTLKGFLDTVDSKEGARGAVVFGKDFVYKVWVQDPAYEAFIDVAAKHQSNPWFPKILKPVRDVKLPLNKPENFTKKLKVVKLERLTMSTQKASSLISMVSSLLEYSRQLQRPSNQGSTSVRKPEFDFDTELNELKLDKTQFIEMLKALEPLTKFRNDLHRGNWMMRGSHPVLVDPFESTVSDDEITINDLSGYTSMFYGEKFTNGDPYKGTGGPF